MGSLGRRSVGAVGLAVSLGAAVLTPGAAAAAEPAAPVEELVVLFDGGAGAAERRAALADQGLELLETTSGDYALVRGPRDVRAGDDPDDAIVAVREPGRVRALGAGDPPNDPGFPLQWHLPQVEVPQVWASTTGAGVVVAVLDTGVARQAPDLSGTTFVAGWDAVDDDPDPADENGHGTHVTGIIAQTTGNGMGLAGVAPGVSIMPVRVLGADGSGSDWDVAAGIRWAADNGADVANLSLGGATSPIIRSAVAYAETLGMTVVAASGNDGAASVSYPASDPLVLGVGATRFDRTRVAYSNYGPDLDVVAPGGDNSVDQSGDGQPDGILQQTVRPDGSACYCYAEGTSMASPAAAAVAALVVSRGVTDPEDVRAIVTGSALDLGAAGRDDETGAGLVQALAAVRAADAFVAGQAAPAPAPAPAPPAPAPAPGGVLSIDNACPTGAAASARFSDVAPDDVHRRAIECMASWGIAGGLGPTTFGPTGRVTRAQMASFLARAIEAAGVALPDSPPDAFDDDAGSVHERRIDQLAALGVVAGVGPRSFRPEGPVSRAQMATFLVRAFDLVSGPDLPPGANRFADDEGDVHAGNIDKVAAAGIAGGTTPTTFSPAAPVSRAQLASFLARTLELLIATGVTAAR